MILEWTDLQLAVLPELSVGPFMTGWNVYPSTLFFWVCSGQDRQTRSTRNTWTVGNPRFAQNQLWQTIRQKWRRCIYSWHQQVVLYNKCLDLWYYRGSSNMLPNNTNEPCTKRQWPYFHILGHLPQRDHTPWLFGKKMSLCGFLCGCFQL